MHSVSSGSCGASAPSDIPLIFSSLSWSTLPSLRAPFSRARAARRNRTSRQVSRDGSKRVQERPQVGLLACRQLCPEDQIEKLDRVVECEQTTIVEVRRRVLDAAQREGLDRTFGGRQNSVDGSVAEEALELEIVQGVVGVIRRRMARRALALVEEHVLTAQFLGARLVRIELAVETELGCWGEIEDLLEFGHVLDLGAAVERIHALLRGQHRVAIEIGRALLEFGEVLDAHQRAL